MKYFICAISGYVGNGGRPIPITDDSCELPEIYNSYDEARAAAEQHRLCQAWGYRIMEWEI